MKGEIEKIWKNQTADGRRYDVLQIGGERYSLWEEDYFDKFQEEGTSVLSLESVERRQLR